MSDNNGFADALSQIKTLLKVDDHVSLDALEEAANYFVDQLKPNIHLSDKRKRTHLRESLKVEVKEDHVQVSFEDDAWYWFLAEHGHRKAGGKGKVAGQHFVQNTFMQEQDKIADIMTSKILKKMEG